MEIRKPAWWQLYMLIPVMGILLGVEHLAPLPGVSEEVVVVGIVILCFAATALWVHVNGGLLEWYEVDRDESYYDLKITVYEPASKKRRNGNGSEETIPFAMPHSYANVTGRESLRLKEEGKWFLN